ncbi:unnamed protein product [Calypogeia fissa]
MSGAGERKEEGDAEEAEMEGDDDDEEEEEGERDAAREGEMEGDDERDGEEDGEEDSGEEEMDGEVDEEEVDDDNVDFHPLLLVQHRALSAESGESATQMRAKEEDEEDGAEEDGTGLVEDENKNKNENEDEEEEEEEEEEDGDDRYLGTAEDVQQMFNGSAEEFMDGVGELDGDDKFFELATDYEEEEDYKVNEDCIAPYVLQQEQQQQPRGPAGEVVRSDESEGEREDDIADPICSRTRARYSLADMSLDQLETFLQGSDEEKDFEAVDDREEYEKFLRAVLEDLPESEKPEESSRKEDEDEEEEDVDFEIEIEELLESDDASESVQRRKRKRPETREKRRQRARFQSRGPLRQLLPHVGGFTDNVSKVVNTAWSSNVNRGPPVSGFTAHQIGQLHSLIHEHVQLLIQTHSICVCDPARQREASDSRNLLLELAEKRETILAGKKTAFPDFCFRPPYTNPSAIEGVKRKPLYCWPPGLPTAPPTIQPKGIKIWEPVICLPVRSLLDVAPLELVPEFLTDMSRVVRARFEDIRQLNGEAGSSKFERVPIFETPLDEQDQSIGRKPIDGTKSLPSGNVELLPNCLPTPPIKQTMAAALVESTEKLGLAPVPKEVALAVRRFLPYFNKALYPHKAPPIASANRLLFADSEDELLAMGIMKHNHNWSAIREEYLPSKEDHQIKIRAKNRSAAKALPNSIKAVHMMKTSPLTDWEKKAIQDGLNYYKQDWKKVWARCVPHRNPDTLQRQWRIAVGTQKSYKTSESSKERRRLYEASRRKKIAAQKARNAPDSNQESTPDVVPGPATTVSPEKQRKLLSKKRKAKPRADNHSQGSLPRLDPQPVKSVCDDRTQAVKLAPHLSLVIMPPHVQVLPQSQVQPQQLFTQQSRTFFAVGSTSDPCTKNIKSRSRNTVRNRDRKDYRRHDPFQEDRSQDPIVEQHIVMEKEELSDSEDEVDAGVEFEHEEMGDSDKDK